jgi:hypothetical protein
VWDATIDGRKLSFHLAGINNQNFIMRDEETGSWWQQVSGEAVLGPLKGRKLKQVNHDEISFAAWKREQPGGRVLKPDERVKDKYAPADWEESIGRLPVVTPSAEGDPLAPRELILGIEINGASKAYKFSDLARQAPLLDTLGGVPILIVMDEERRSARVFDRTLDGRALELFLKPETAPLRLVDSETGSEWDFSGKAVAGALAGRSLVKLPSLSDYWFDWKIYHPDTVVYQ